MQVRVEKVAHGGHFIARNEGQVIFIRDTAPGELVEIEITSKAQGFLRANVLQVIESSPERITPPCVYAGRCGGCDFQHLNLPYQRKLKAEVIKEQFSRIAKMDVEVTVHEVAPTTRYRTHIRGVASEAGQFGIYASRSHEIIPISDCLIAGEELHVAQIATKEFEPMEPIEVPQGDQIKEVKGKQLLVKAGAFWQRHRNAPETLTTQFLKLANLKAGEHLLDLYGGVGLFTSVAIDVLGPGGRVDLIESSIPATDSARENFKDYANVKIVREDVVKGLKSIKRADVVVLDPPRAGAGAEVVSQLLRINPSRLVYVACDPASLARDVKDFIAAGWSLKQIDGYDLFPMTQHIESICLLGPNKIS
ncbi:MAG: class I SAM-dependent RNA methyltransferase [Candidatus Nanopelagicaceae bacterium]